MANKITKILGEMSESELVWLRGEIDKVLSSQPAEEKTFIFGHPGAGKSFAVHVRIFDDRISQLEAEIERVKLLRAEFLAIREREG